MKKWFGIALILVLLIICILPTKAEAATEGYYTYTVSNGEATIIDCDKSISGEIIIPSTLGGYPVTSIGDGAFESCENLTGITIGDGVTIIESYAFYYCTSLLNVSLPDSITSVEHSAFEDCNLSYNIYDNAMYLGNSENPYIALILPTSEEITSCVIHPETKVIGGRGLADCSNLTEIIIPNSVTGIGTYAFQACEGLTSVTIGNSVNDIGKYAFQMCSSLADINIPDSVTIIRKGAFGYCESLSSITIPDSVTSLGYAVFEGCSSLSYNTYDNGIYLGNNKDPYLALIEVTDEDTTSCVIHPETQIIGGGALEGCSALTSINIPNSITSIGDSAFAYCSSLTSVAIPKGITSIDDYMFYYCENLTSITIPDSVTNIGDSAFRFCENLTSVNIPDSVSKIDDYAFYHCSGLSNITIPEGVTSIGCYAFCFCNSLTSINIPNSVTNIGAFAFTHTGLTSVTMGNGSIDDYTFSGCNNLTNITMLDSVTSIGDYAFDYCGSLTSVTLPDSITSIGEGAFNDCSNLSKVHYTGTQAEKTNISIASDNTYLTNASWHYEVQKMQMNGVTVYSCSQCGQFYADGTKAPLQQLEITSLPTKLRYYTGQEISIDGISLNGSYSDGSQIVLFADAVDRIEADLSSPGRKTATVTSAGATATFEIIVHDTLFESVVVDSSLYPQSSHDYENDANETKTFTCPNAISLTITFNSQTSVESGYDYIYVYDRKGNEIARYTGATAANKTLTIPGDTFKIKLTSDGSYTEYGYAFSSIVAELSGEEIHIPVVDPAVTATCIQSGLTEGSHCQICDEVLIAQEEIPAPGHSYQDGACSVCGAKEAFTMVLTEDTQINLRLTEDLRVDLNGFCLTGTIITNGFKVYGMDSTTDGYSCESIGYFTCVDENGDFIVPERIYTNGEKQYIAICTEDRYSFHRFFVGVTHMSLEPEVVGLGYKAAIFGDEMVFAELAATKAFSFRVQLEGYNPVYRYFDSKKLACGDPITLRIRNYDVENYSEHNLYAQVSLTLNDGTVIETEQVSLTFRWLTEQVNANYTDYTPDQLAMFAAMLQKFTIVKKWNIPNLI